MPYRSGPEGGAPSRIVLCVACARPTELHARETELRCAGCQRQQPAVRVDAAAPLVHRAAGHQVSGYSELVPYAKTLGIDGGLVQVTVNADGLLVNVTLSLNSGSAVGVDIDAQTLGFPDIVMTRESHEDRRAKASGLSREHQTGDPTFDEHVYVDTAITDADLAVILASPAVRAAITELLVDFKHIELDAKGVSLSNNESKTACYEPERIARNVRALRVVAGAARPIKSTTRPRSAFERAMWVVTLPLFPVGLAAFIASLVYLRPACDWLPWAGLGAGVVLAALWSFVISRVVRGRSSSRADLFLGRAMSFAGLPFLTSAVLIATNAWADESPERMDRMVVTEVDFDSEDDDSTLELHGQTRDLEGLEVRFSDYGQRIKVGDTVTVWTRTGACGCRWHTRDSILRLQGNGELITE